MANDQVTRLSTKEAKPCPFCGKQPEIQHWEGGGPQKRIIVCTNEMCQAQPSVSGPTKKRALEHWNYRKGDS
jgi:hypothetical protein